MKQSLNEKKVRVAEELQKLSVLEAHPRLYNSTNGVLLSDEIELLAQTGNFIVPFNKDSLKPAGYELSVGDEWYIEGVFHKFGDKNSPNYIEIKPFQVAVLKTKEILCIPRFLIARWNIRVKHVYDGLLWVGAPQVDPGYKGYLFCPIYNLSGKNVVIKEAEPLALMDFVKTTPFNKGQSKEYPFNSKRLIIEDYVHGLESGLFSEVKGRLDEFDRELRGNEKTIIGFASTVFAVLALVVTLIVSFVVGGQSKFTIDVSFLLSFCVWVSSFGAIVSLFILLSRRAYLSRRSDINLQSYIKHKKLWYWSPRFGIPMSLLVSCVIGAGFLGVAKNSDYFSNPEIQEIRSQTDSIERRLEELKLELDERRR